MFIASPSGSPITPDVSGALEYCARATRTHARTFYFASRFLPKEKRQACYAVYAFCRYMDDIADQTEGDTQDPQERHHLLNLWERHLEEVYLGKTVSHPIMIAWAHIMHRYHIPIDHALTLIDGVRSDLNFTPLPTWDALADYCYKVASVVGLMTARIFRFQRDEALEYAQDLGTALQITNILRDVGEDALRGRIYFPTEDLRRFSVREDDILQHRLTDEFVHLMRHYIEKARNLYAEADKGIALLARDSRFTVRLMSTNYRRILDRIERNKYDVFTRRASVSLFRKITSIPAIALRMAWKG